MDRDPSPTPDAVGAGRLGPLVWRLVAFSVAVWLAAWIGRATFQEAAGFSMVWPASGLGLIWLASGNRRTWAVDSTVLALVTGLAVLTAAGTVQNSLLAALLGAVQPVVYLVVMRRAAPDVWGSGGTRPFSRVRDIGSFLLACALAAAVTSLLRWTGVGLMPVGEEIEILLVAIRNFAWMVAIGAVALQLGPYVAASSSIRDLLHRLRQVTVPGGLRSNLEMLLLVGVTALLYFQVVARFPRTPITFLLTLATVWAAVRLPPIVAALHALGSGTAAVLLTMHGRGSFLAVDEGQISAMLAQLFLVVLSISAVTLAFSASERDLALARAADSEQAEAERSALLTAVLENMREGVEVVQEDGEVLVRNPAGRRVLGLGRPGPAPAAEASAVELLLPDGQRVPRARLPHVRALAGEDVEAEDYRVNVSGAAAGRILEMTATPMPRQAPDRAGRAVVTFRDVTADRRERDNLASFAGVIAHDLLNPLTVVGGWADSLADAFHDGPVDPAEGAAMLERIQDASRQMRQFIDDLLAYTIAADHRLQIEDLDLSMIGEGIARLRRGGALSPIIEVQPEMRVQADGALARQVLDNLIGNATKYVGPGVRPHIQVSGQAQDDWFAVSVTDNGIGVPVEHRERIFDNFHRANPQGYPGTGIGLAICRRAVERHGGHIRVEENPHTAGSRFVFTLPRSSSGVPVTRDGHQPEHQRSSP